FGVAGLKLQRVALRLSQFENNSLSPLKMPIALGDGSLTNAFRIAKNQPRGLGNFHLDFLEFRLRHPSGVGSGAGRCFGKLGAFARQLAGAASRNGWRSVGACERSD